MSGACVIKCNDCETNQSVASVCCKHVACITVAKLNKLAKVKLNMFYKYVIMCISN